MNPKRLRTILILLIVGINIGCDQVTKSIAREEIQLHEQIEVIGRNLVLTKVENEGAFLGMGSSLPPVIRGILLLWLPAAVMVALLVFLFTQKNISKPMLIGLSFIVGGGIGNLFDRIAHGSVTDFLHIDFEIFKTGIFNVADMSVMFGTALIFIYSFQKKKDLNDKGLEQTV